MDSRSCKLSPAFSLLMAMVLLPVGLAGQERLEDAKITILQTTDIHHHANGAKHVGLDVDPVDGTSAVGAYSRISAYVEYVRHSTDHPVLLVDSGDWTMGTFYDLTLGSRPLALYYLNLMHYDCVTLGNHEFDYTSKGLAEMIGAAQNVFDFEIPIVASNLILGGDTDLAPFVGSGKAIETTRVQELPNGIKVGYIGLMGKSAALDAAGSAPVSFASLPTQYAVIQGLVNQLRNDRHVDIVIALSHSGTDPTGTSGEDVDLARNVTGINLIASGHTHTPLAAAHTVTNGQWSTYIVDAGAYGTNVSRIDLTYHARTHTTTLDASSNPAMTDASLDEIHPGLAHDRRQISQVVYVNDQEINRELGPFFAQTFADYASADLGKGIYHPVGIAAQDMESNGRSPVPAPNGLGDLAADAVRSVPNSIIQQTLASVGGNPAKLPGYDFTPIQASIVATGVLRGVLQTGVPLTFADTYNVLPLGISPDSTQALPIGFPLVSGYLEVADVKKLCALQLIAQTGLAPSDYYLNFSGLRYSLDPTASYVYFKYGTGAAVLQETAQKAAGGSASAAQALGALSTLGTDSGAAMLAAYSSGNPYATAMVKLNDSGPSGAQIFANLGAIGQVAAAAAADRAAGTNTLSALVVSKAVAAVNGVAGFSAADSANTGPAADLTGAARVRVVADLYAFLLVGALQTQFGTTVTAYQSATGPATLSGADIPGLLANRIDAEPGTPGVQELKEWMALLSYLDKGLGGVVTPVYSSALDFTQFPTFGLAVQTRSATYPLTNIVQLVSTVGTLETAP